MPARAFLRPDRPRRRVAALIAGVLAAAFGCLGVDASAQPPSLADVRALRGRVIKRVEVKSPVAAVDRTRLLKLADLREGATLSIAAVRGAIERLYATGTLSDVVVRARAEGDGVALTLELAPRVRLGQLRFRGNTVLTDDDLRKDFGFQPDSEYSADVIEKLETSLAQSYRRRGFHAARFDMELLEEPGGERVRIEVEVHEGPPTRMRRITLDGDTLFKRDELLRVLRIREGDVVDRERLRTGVDALGAFYRKSGYYEVSIKEPEVEVLKTGDEARVRFQILPGPRVVIDFVDARGFARAALLSRLRLDDERKLDASTLGVLRERLETFLFEGGFLRGRVLASMSTKKGPPAEKRLVFRFMPGPRVRVIELAFPGVRAFPESRLREIVLSLVEEKVAKGGLFESVYPEQVTQVFGVGTEGAGRTAEGHPSRALPPRQVYLESAYRESLEDIEKLYKAAGYTKVKLSPPRTIPVPPAEDVRVEIAVEEGPRSHVGDVRFVGNFVLTDDDLAKEIGLPKGTPYNPTVIEEARRKIQRRYEQLGFIFVRVDDTTKPSGKDGTHVDVTFEMKENERVHIGQIKLEGNVRTRDPVIYDVLKILPGEIYNSRRIADSQQALFDLGLFSSVSIEPESMEPERLKNLRVRVRERNPGAVETGFGFSYYDGPRGFANVSYSNLFGYNLRAIFYLKLNYQLFLFADPASRAARLGELSFVDLLERQLTASLQYPKILGLPIPLGARFDLSHQRRSQLAFGLDKYITALASLELKVSPRFNFQLQYEFEWTDLQTPHALDAFIKDVDRSPILTISEREQLKRTTLGRQLFGSIRPIFSLDLRDNPFNPRKGFIGTVLAEYSASVTAGNVNYFKLQGTFTGHIPIGKKSQIALQASTGAILHLSNASHTPAHRAFYLGGRSSIRGYAEESIIPEGRAILPSEVDALLRSGLPPTSTGGEVYYFGKAELRVPLTGSLMGALFYDVGNLYLNKDSFDLLRVPRMSTGVGIRVPTPVGPINFDIGFNLTRRYLRAEDPTTGLVRDVPYEGIFQIHFSVGVF